MIESHDVASAAMALPADARAELAERLSSRTSSRPRLTQLGPKRPSGESGSSTGAKSN